MTKYKLKYNFLIPVLRIVLIATFIWVLGKIISDIINNGLELNSNLFFLIFYISILIYLLFRTTKRLISESNFIILNKEKIIIYNLALFKKLTFNTNECIFFTSYRTPYHTLILKLPTGKYIHLLPYDYFDFKKLDELFVKFGIRKEGYIGDNYI